MLRLVLEAKARLGPPTGGVNAGRAVGRRRVMWGGRDGERASYGRAGAGGMGEDGAEKGHGEGSDRFL